MESRVMGNYHARFGAGENPEIRSKDYLSLFNSALNTWNDKLAEIWILVSTSPENFKGGGIWDVILNINDGLKAVGYALLVLFFVMGIVKTCSSFAEVKHS